MVSHRLGLAPALSELTSPAPAASLATALARAESGSEERQDTRAVEEDFEIYDSFITNH